ncbi:MAG TPA: amidophosphoribosyltransferase, partial [Acidimicrobiales bacterium]|nr:amidophosphoribosyltransferase [Acidimicrobiales bacterium]
MLDAAASPGDGDGLKEACGVFGVHGPGQPVAQLTYLGLFALQHRGQEAAGMAVSDGETLTVVKDQGLVAAVFDDRTLAGLSGHLAIGHCRYSTTGSSTWRNAQPVYRSVGEHEFALGHNGNLVNTERLAKEAGMLEGMVTSDSDLVAELIGKELAHRPLEDAVCEVVRQLEGAFSLVLMDELRVAGVRDPHGFRPLCLGRLPADADGENAGEGWILASESPALDIVGAEFVRELEPGEMVVIDADGPRSLFPFAPDEIEPALCLFEFVYFARPDADLYGRSVASVRVRMGEELAEQAPLPIDELDPPRPAMVMPVPESGVPAAQGFARVSGIPYGDGLVKNRYIGRTFIAPSPERRAQGVRMKLNPLRDQIAGKRLVVVDDSIVRGTTTRAVVAMLREAGAAEVHLRIMSPPYRWPCFYGMDTGARADLLAADLSVDEIREYVAADSLAYLTLDRLVSAVAAPGAGF